MILFLPAVLSVFLGSAKGAYPAHLRDLSIAPEFDATPLSVNVMPGETALLPCRVRNLSDKVVSWMRRKDLLIISSGRFMFTADSRFQIISPDTDPATWNLQLRQAKPSDEGLYECQVNTDPKLKQAVLLTVSDEDTMILGSKERNVRVGSTLSITCHIRTKPDTARGRQRPVRLVDWLHNDVPLFDELGTLVAGVDTEKNGDELSSTLTVSSIGPQAAGKYTCKPFSGPSATLMVNVLEGERTEAMQGHSPASTLSPSLYLLLFMHLMAVCLLRT